jgi:hypothetical protein
MLEGGALRSLLDSLETQYRVGSKVAYEIHHLVALQCCQATSPFHSRITLRSEHYDHYSMRNNERSQQFVVIFFKDANTELHQQSGDGTTGLGNRIGFDLGIVLPTLRISSRADAESKTRKNEMQPYSTLSNLVI